MIKQADDKYIGKYGNNYSALKGAKIIVTESGFLLSEIRKIKIYVDLVNKM